MNKKRISFNILLISVSIIGVTGVMNGVKHHETWLIILNAITLGLLMIAAIVKIIKAARQKV
jgi:hypothetical protein